jgi:hypothetical protein
MGSSSVEIDFASAALESQDYSVVRGLASPAVKHVSNAGFRDGTLAHPATLLTPCQINNMLVSVRPSARIMILEIINEATTSPAV